MGFKFGIETKCKCGGRFPNWFGSAGRLAIGGILIVFNSGSKGVAWLPFWTGNFLVLITFDASSISLSCNSMLCVGVSDSRLMDSRVSACNVIVGDDLWKVTICFDFCFFTSAEPLIHIFRAPESRLFGGDFSPTSTDGSLAMSFPTSWVTVLALAGVAEDVVEFYLSL